MKKFRMDDRVEVAPRKDGKWTPGRYIFSEPESKTHFVHADGDSMPRNYKFCRPMENNAE